MSTWDQEGSIEGYRTARAVSCRTRTTPAIRLTGQDTGLSIPRKRRGSLRPDATPTVSVVCYPGHGLQKEGGLDRYLQLRLGGGGGGGVLCDGKPAFGPWTKKEDYLHINCLEMLAVWLGLCPFLPDPRGHHILISLDSMMVVSYINHQGGLSPRCLFTLKCLAESSACAGQTEPGSRHAISEQCSLRRVDAPPTNDSGNMGNLRQARGRPLCLRKQHSLPNVFVCKYMHVMHQMHWPTIGPTSSFMLFTDKHGECVSCLGVAHAEKVLIGT